MGKAARQAFFVPTYVERGEGRRAHGGSVRLLDRFFRGERIRLLNFSSGGFSAEGAEKLQIGDLVWINLPGIGLVRSQLRWRDGERFGASFLAKDDLRLRFINGLPTE